MIFYRAAFLLLLLAFAACGGSDEPAPAERRSQAGQAPGAAPATTEVAAAASAAAESAGAAEADAQSGGDLALGESVYKKACFACHGAGVAGAPKLGDGADWGPRIAKGKDVLYEHSINGFTGEKGMMPPKGGFASLSDDEVRAGVDYMVAQAQ